MSLQHIATHCNTLQRTATHEVQTSSVSRKSNTLQRTTTHCNTLLPTQKDIEYRSHLGPHTVHVNSCHVHEPVSLTSSPPRLSSPASPGTPTTSSSSRSTPKESRSNQPVCSHRTDEPPTVSASERERDRQRESASEWDPERGGGASEREREAEREGVLTLSRGVDEIEASQLKIALLDSPLVIS